MYTIKKKFRFEAAHRLEDHDGKCARLHGHSYKVTIEFAAKTVIEDGAKRGMVMDFSQVKAWMQPLLDDHLDHHYLNESLKIYPTAENIAAWIFNELGGRIFQSGGLHPSICLHAVEVGETCTAAARYGVA